MIGPNISPLDAALYEFRGKDVNKQPLSLILLLLLLLTTFNEDRGTL